MSMLICFIPGHLSHLRLPCPNVCPLYRFDFSPAAALLPEPQFFPMVLGRLFWIFVSDDM